MAAESADNKVILNSLEQVISNCVLEELEIRKMPSFDVEYLFLKLREKSIGEVIKVNVTDPEVKKKFEVDINLSKVTIKKNQKHESLIKFGSDLAIQMKYPNVETILLMDQSKTLMENGFSVLASCIEKIYDKETVYDAKDYTQAEMQEFLDQFTQEMYEKLGKFFESMPSIYYEAEELSPYTNKKVKVVIDKFMDFF
jgi:TusA-related sulfurtransferase